ncbi:hypothetical protein HUN01_18805 [Nostoc edaphicum CCNP1411]|uniref:Uncharacterized protein n=1 Tax=Nostoc edaphicum CCNP1411 TaxID=1472755 RepID=A0A7D7LHW5_9NOSO|nr:hypothetical protein [Nostoc edaphicum]QMS89527.1 hypothetical protein HUN01_18805 [Nostoc edaphicum CCNP1411]
MSVAIADSMMALQAIALQKTSKTKRSLVMEECAIALQKTSKIKRSPIMEE